MYMYIMLTNCMSLVDGKMELETIVHPICFSNLDLATYELRNEIDESWFVSEKDGLMQWTAPLKDKSKYRPAQSITLYQVKVIK